MTDPLVSEILRRAGAEHQARTPAEVIEHPLRSKFLDRTAEKPEGMEVSAPVAFALRIGPYLSAVLLALMLFVAWLNVSNYLSRMMILADIGEATCAPENSLLWIEQDPGSDVPRLKDEVLTRCAKAYKLS